MKTLVEVLRDPFFKEGHWWSKNGDGTEFRLLDVAPHLEAETLKDESHIALRKFKNKVADEIERLQAENTILFRIIQDDPYAVERFNAAWERHLRDASGQGGSLTRKQAVESKEGASK